MPARLKDVLAPRKQAATGSILVVLRLQAPSPICLRIPEEKEPRIVPTPFPQPVAILNRQVTLQSVMLARVV